MTHTAVRNVAFSLLLATVALGCGQVGPLMLPGDARPVERLETPPAAPPESRDDEAEDER